MAAHKPPSYRSPAAHGQRGQPKQGLPLARKLSLERGGLSLSRPSRPIESSSTAAARPTGATRRVQDPPSGHDSHPRLGRTRLVAEEDFIEPSEASRLRLENERLRNDLYLAQSEVARARREGRLEVYERLLGGIGHELRTSLTLVLGWTELLVNERLSLERATQAHDTIYAAGWRIEAALRWVERQSEAELRALDGTLDESV